MRFSQYVMVGLLVITAGPTWGQTAVERLSSNPAALRDATAAARVEATARLVRQVLNLPVPETTSEPGAQTQRSVSRLGEDPLIRRIEPGFLEICQSAQSFGKVRTYLDGSAEVDLVLPGKEVREVLKSLLEPWFLDYAVTQPPHESKQLLQKLERIEFPALICVTGVGRPEQMRSTPVPPVSGQPQAPDIPPGWAGVSETGRMLASRAAAAEAQFRMFHLVLGLKVEGGKRLVDVLDPTGRNAVEQWLINRGSESTAFNPNGVASAKMRIRQEELISALEKVKNKSSQPIKLREPPMELVVQGFVFAPPEEVSATQPAGICRARSLPEWAKKSLRVTARSTLTENRLHQPMAPEAAAYQARINTLLALLDELGKIAIAPGVTYNDLLSAYQDAKTDTNTLLSAARVVEERKLPDGQCEVTMELNLERAGMIVNFYGVPQPKP